MIELDGVTYVKINGLRTRSYGDSGTKILTTGCVGAIVHISQMD